MRVLAVGDIHGCFTEFSELLEAARFDPASDLLLSTGDIIGRGPKPLETLRYFLRHRDRIVTVLGNHELSLLRNYSIWRQNKSTAARDQFLAELKARELGMILKDPDGEEMIAYLRSRPLAYYDKERQLLLSHAGLAPEWSTSQALACAAETEQVLQSGLFDSFMANMFSDKPDSWSKIQKKEKKQKKSEKQTDRDDGAQDEEPTASLSPLKLKRLIYTVNAFTRMRFCRSDRSLEFMCKDGPETARQQYGLLPWYELADKLLPGEKIVFGHWAALEGKCPRPGIVALETGCVWNGSLSMTDLDHLNLRYVVKAHH